MLARKNRFSLTTNYQKLKNQGKWLNFPFFNLLYSYHLKNNVPLVAIVVGVKVSRLSARRHRIKRLISEAVRSTLLSLPPNLTMAIFAKKEINEKSLGEIKTELEKGLIQINHETIKS